MAKVKIELNHAEFRALLTSPEVTADLGGRAEAIAAAAGPGHRVEVNPGTKRSRAAVITDTAEARRAEATERRLTRAVDAGR